MNPNPSNYVATPSAAVCGQHSIIINRSAPPSALSVPAPIPEPSIYIVGPVKAAVETRATEVLAKLNQ